MCGVFCYRRQFSLRNGCSLNAWAIARATTSAKHAFHSWIVYNRATVCTWSPQDWKFQFWDWVQSIKRHIRVRHLDWSNIVYHAKIVPLLMQSDGDHQRMKRETAAIRSDEIPARCRWISPAALRAQLIAGTCPVINSSRLVCRLPRFYAAGNRILWRCASPRCHLSRRTSAGRFFDVRFAVLFSIKVWKVTWILAGAAAWDVLWNIQQRVAVTSWVENRSPTQKSTYT